MVPGRLTRKAQGVTGPALIAGMNVASAFKTLATAAVEERIETAGLAHDLDGDGRVTTGDATILARWLSGFRGSVLTNGIALSGPRNTSTLITTFIESGCPVVRPTVQKFLWSNPSTWSGGIVPGIGAQVGADVVIPAGRSIVLDIDVNVGSLEINGVLEFADRDLRLSARWIMAMGQDSEFRIGRASQPHTRRATITLTGANASENVMRMGTKFLGAMDGGKIRMFGEPRVNWTKLAATANAGNSVITLERTVDWRVGEKIVIAPSGYDGNETEERTITAVNGTAITLDRALAYRHWGQMQSFGGISLDERAEVGLLSRNIVVTSDLLTNSAASAIGLGGHIMTMEGSHAQYFGVEFSNLGQTARLGRYGGPHWHLVGNGAGQFLSGSSIHHSLNRFSSIHATNDVWVEGNVAYDAVGHGFIVEDGVENRNVFDGNLALVVRAVETNKLIASDDLPSVFWLSNPNNVLRNNVAAGSIGGNGFWYELPPRPTGLSANIDLAVFEEPFGAFEKNVAHSNQRITSGGEPGAGLRFDQYLGSTQIRDFTSYRNSTGIWLASETLSSTHYVSNPKLSSNLTQTLDTNSYLTNALYVATSDNAFANEPAKKEGSHIYDGQTSVDGAVVVNFRGDYRFIIFRDTNESTDITSRFSNIRYINSDAPRGVFEYYLEYSQAGGDPAATRDMLFDDVDGSLLGGAPAWIVYRNPLQLSSSCTTNPTLPFARICPKASNGYLRTGGYFFSGEDVSLTRDDGATLPVGAQYLRTGHTYRLGYSGSPTGTLRIGGIYGDRQTPLASTSTNPQVAFVRFVVTLPPGWSNLREFYRPPAQSLAAMQASTTNAYFHDRATNELHVKIVASQVADGFVFDR
jgi:cell surface hyaluronidase